MLVGKCMESARLYDFLSVPFLHGRPRNLIAREIMAWYKTGMADARARFEDKIHDKAIEANR